jgi:hypothetical protein
MKHMLEKLAGKADDEGDDSHAHAKMQVLHELRNMAMGMMGDKVKGKLPGHEMHEVDVVAPDREGLAKGLGLAQHMTGPHDALTGPKGPPDSLNGDKDSGYGETLNSTMPHKGSNGSQMDAAAEDESEQTEHGRSEPEGDEGEPDQHMLNPHRNSSTEDDMYDDMGHDELDQHIEHLKKLKQAKMLRK